VKVELKEFGRLDKVLSNALNEPRNQVENLIKNVGVTIEGQKIYKPSYKIEKICTVEYAPMAAKELQTYKVDFDVEVLYEDDDLLIVNKRPFLVVHQAPSVKEATLVDWLQAKGVNLSTLSGEMRHGIVHRIDKQTSGALVVAKNNYTHQHLSQQLQSKTMGRYYLALIDGGLKDYIIVNQPIGRNPKNRLKMGIVEGGREAKSAFAQIEKSQKDEVAIIACKLFTGRTHQIRVHLGFLGRHILGDDLYGFKSKKGKIDRVMLHAYLIYLIHPRSNEILSCQAPLFDDFTSAMYRFFDKKVIDEKIDASAVVDSFVGVDQWMSR
jgi:23S rRNA pseudouridine1911/1915/1917 synthase